MCASSEASFVPLDTIELESMVCLWTFCDVVGLPGADGDAHAFVSWPSPSIARRMYDYVQADCYSGVKGSAGLGWMDAARFDLYRGHVRG